jgi:septal ring-binding cell division protein DamX
MSGFRRSSLLIPALFLLCHASFAGDIKVIGTIPATDTGKTYQLQIGAFDIDNNVKKAVDNLKQNGFVPYCEKVENKMHGFLTRVFVVANAKDVCNAINGLDRAGYSEVIIREYLLKAGTAKTAETKTPPPKETKTSTPKQDVKPPQNQAAQKKAEQAPLEKQKLDFEKDPPQIKHLFLTLYPRQGGY